MTSVGHVPYEAQVWAGRDLFMLRLKSRDRD
jgi:hypothetical protein